MSRVRATDRHCRQMRRNNKFGAKNMNLATTIGENFCLASERLLRLKIIASCRLMVINVYLNCQLMPNYRPHNSVADRVKPGQALLACGDRHALLTAATTDHNIHGVIL